MSDRRRVIRRIHAAAERGVFTLTGGGSLLLSDLLSAPGASATVLACDVPYAPASLAELLGSPPDQACSAATACDLASVAFQRALRLDGAAGERARRLLGVAISAALRSTKRRRGAHRAHIAVQTLEATRCWTLELARDRRTRLQEERLLRDVALWALARAMQLEAGAGFELREGDRLTAAEAEAPIAWQELLLGSVAAVPVQGNVAPKVLYPGAFNPLHDGHRAIADYARRLTGEPVVFEICANNLDKPRLNYLALRHRLPQFDATTPVWLTNLASFNEKARHFPGTLLLVGTDTLARIAEPRYYDDDPTKLDAAMSELAGLGCRFLVFGRRIGQGFVGLEDLELPPALEAICDGVPEDDFRVDTSSSALRRAEAEYPISMRDA